MNKYKWTIKPYKSTNKKIEGIIEVESMDVAKMIIKEKTRQYYQKTKCCALEVEINKM